MPNFCQYCGKPLEKDARFCIGCGKPVTPAPDGAPKAQPNHPVQPAAKTEPTAEVKTTANEEQTVQTESGSPETDTAKKGGILEALLGEIKYLLKHPKKLIPTIVLSVVWLLFSILSTVGVNIPVLRFLYTLTYANGGMFGGFPGAVGGIFGKAVFAAVVNMIVLSLLNKKNPFAGKGKQLAAVFGKAAFSGLNAVAPFLIGAGSGVLLYWLFNITSSPVNSAIAVVGAVGALLAVGKKNGLLTSLIFSVAGKLSKGKLPSQTVVNRALTGFSAGFAIAFPLTFARYSWLLFLIGAVILGTGIAFVFVGKNGAKKAAAAAALLLITSMMLLPLFSMPVRADSDSLFGDDDLQPYRGHLTYSNGRVNKYGQPFPDLMDFDNDGVITWLDLNIQKELSHDPDWLNRPMSKAMGVFLSIMTGIFGAAGGLAGSLLSGLLGESASAAASAIEGLPDLGSNGSEEPEEEKDEDLGPYITADGDGDLNVKDPATGEERTYVANGDGTYTNPITGATYTKDELKASLESRAENADLISKDDATAKEAIREQREENQGMSQIGRELEAQAAAERAKEEAEADHNKYIEGLADKYGVYSGNDDLYNRIGEKKNQAEIEGYEQREYEKEYQDKQKYVENVKKGADVAIDIYAEVDPTQTGKKLKDAYSVATAAASNAGDVMAGYKTVGGAFVQTVVDSGVELAKNHAEGATQKFAANIMGDSTKAMSDTYMKGGSVEDIRKAGEGAAIQGGINATVDVAFDAFGGKANEKLGLTGDKVIGSIGGQSITKDMAGGGAKVIANTAVKDALTPNDADDVKRDAMRDAQEKAEADANAEAAASFKRAQEEWKARKNEEQ